MSRLLYLFFSFRLNRLDFFPVKLRIILYRNVQSWAPQDFFLVRNQISDFIVRYRKSANALFKTLICYRKSAMAF